jgi:hypothetical protein
MKFALFFCCFLILLVSCEKQGNVFSVGSDTTQNILPQLKKGGGGTTPVPGPISFVGGAYRLIGGNSDSIQINLTQTAGPGWVLSLSSNDPNVQVPAAFAVPAGALYVHVPITSSVISSSRNVIITATLQGQTMTSLPFKVFPLHVSFPAPQLQSPGNGSGFKNRIQVKFAWSDNANAYYHDIQISDNSSFGGTPMLEVYLNDPVWAASYFNGLGIRYWRVRYIDASGGFGPWSAVRSFEIRP